MGEFVFELEYTDRATRDRVRVEVPELGMARAMAAELAKASGRRAIIRRKRRSRRLWSVQLADARSGEIERLWSGLTKQEVLLRWKRWKEYKSDCVLVAWPEWLPAIVMTFERAA